MRGEPRDLSRSLLAASYCERTVARPLSSFVVWTTFLAAKEFETRLSSSTLDLVHLPNRPKFHADDTTHVYRIHRLWSLAAWPSAGPCYTWLAGTFTPSAGLEPEGVCSRIQRLAHGAVNQTPAKGDIRRGDDALEPLLRTT